MTKEEIFKKMFAYNENGEFVRREQLIDQEEKTVEITIGDDTIRDLILRQADPLTTQEKLRALFSYEEKKDDLYPISARELHVFLEIGKDFSNWIKDMIDKYDFEEDQGYKKCSPNLASGSNGGQNKIEYYVTIDVAKEMAMVQRTDLGKLVRRYLIWAEKQLHNLVASKQEEKFPTQLKTPMQFIAAISTEMVKQEEKLSDHEEKLSDLEKRLTIVESSLLRKNEPPSAVINRNISVGEMAKILKDIGYDTGRTRLFSWLTEKGFITRYGKKGYLADLSLEREGYVLTKKNRSETADGTFQTCTIEITPKGQEWLIREYTDRKD